MALAQRGKDRPLIISCFFGGQIRIVYPAVKGYECIFFSNSDQFRSLICSRGWKFRLVKTLPPATDYLQDSIQAKYIKFLQFFPEFQEFANREWIIYFDHTVFVRKSDLDWIRLHHHPDKCALVLRHLAADRTIWGEVEAASSQLRYAQAMPQTIEWLQGLVKSHSISLDCTVDATTLISYLRWMAFIGQTGLLTSLTQGGRNRVHCHCRPHGEFCLPVCCAVLHGHTSRRSGPG